MWVMKLQLSRMQQRQLLQWAEQAGKNECCGLVLGHGGIVERVELTANVANDPSCEFEIDPSALIVAQKRARHDGPAILGYFHSHPNGITRPSAEDARLATADGRNWLIIADGRITLWRPVSAGEGEPVNFNLEGFFEG